MIGEPRRTASRWGKPPPAAPDADAVCPRPRRSRMSAIPKVTVNILNEDAPRPRVSVGASGERGMRTPHISLVDYPDLRGCDDSVPVRAVLVQARA